MNFLPLAALAIALSGALALLNRSRRNGSLAALADREPLSDVQIYRQFYATNDLEEAEVCTLWNEIAGTLQVPADKLRPSDRFGTDIGVWFITSKHPVNPSCQLGGAGRPAMREQFGDVGRLVGRQSREDVFQIGVGIVPVELGRLDQAHDGSRALTGAQ